MKKILLMLFLGVGFFIASPLSFARQDDFGLITAKGWVNTTQIGGSGLYVFSMWNNGRKVFVEPDGSFSISILSSTRPQKIAIKDINERTRALAFVMADDAQNIRVDAASTAMPILFSDPGAIKNAEDMGRSLAAVAKLTSCQNFITFLKKNLSLKTIEELVSDDAYVSLFEQCNRELFHVDRAVINQSLYEAQGELEGSFGEK